MILVADSGSTKTDWRLIKSNGDVGTFSTIGFNPYHVTEALVLEHLNRSKLIAIKEAVTEVFFYGAGCSSKEKCTIIGNPLREFFNRAVVRVEHDMLGAARATCGNDSGMVGILGTGSNSCLYNGQDIIENVPALGYILGDYGSGVHIGKRFLQALLGKELPKEVEQTFKQEFQLDLSAILDAVYKQPLPNRFLAGFSRFVYHHLDVPELYAIVVECFDDFFLTNITKYTDYQEYQLHLIGSVASVYREVIKEVAEDYEVKLGKVIQQPIEELVKFHQ